MSIKDFVILTKLGQGAYSSVYKVQRISDQTEYALKKVKLGNLSEKQLQNALNEVRILASINNPNIIGYKDAFLEGKSLCIIMEFADGGDLYQKISTNKEKQKFFEEDELWSVLIQVVRALNTLHDMKIYHRDIKSANVFLNKDGSVKLGDLNVSKIAKNGMLYTQTGTPYYASPEVWKDQPYDDKSDIWSFGCVIYQMAALDTPFKAEDMEGLGKSVTEGKYPSIPAFYSNDLAGVIKMMLQLKPKNRPSTKKLLKSALLGKKANQLNLEYSSGKLQSQQLLQTIRIPKNLYYLTDRLPNANYDTKKISDINRSMPKVSRGRERQRYNRQSTLPKIDRILQRHEEMIRERQRKSSGNGSVKNRILSIEGHSKLLGQARRGDKHKSIERQRNLARGYNRDHRKSVDNGKGYLPPILRNHH